MQHSTNKETLRRNRETLSEPYRGTIRKRVVRVVRRRAFDNDGTKGFAESVQRLKTIVELHCSGVAI